MSSLQTPEQMLDEHRKHRQEAADDVDPSVRAEIIQHTLDQHYRRVLDEPVPALGDKAPRQCVRSKQGRQQVIEWLKLLENNERRRAAGQGQPPYEQPLDVGGAGTGAAPGRAAVVPLYGFRIGHTRLLRPIG